MRILSKGVTKSHLTLRKRPWLPNREWTVVGTEGHLRSCCGNAGERLWGRTEKEPDLAREKGRALICYCRMWM